MTVSKLRRCSAALVALFLFSVTPHSQAIRGNFLNFAILTIPPKYLADIPLDNRDVLLKELSYENDDPRLDYQHGFLTFHSDGGDVNASSMFNLKVLPTDSPFDAPVFVHMQKPFNGVKPSKDDTFVLQYNGKSWDDITDKVFPKGIDRTSYFNPLRLSEDVEVAPWVRRGNKGSYEYGECKILLHWNGKTFDKISIKPRKVTLDLAP